MEGLFWLSICGVLYPYLGYPVLLWAVGCFVSPRRDDSPPVCPFVSMIIPVHNEEAAIERKVANTAALLYPAERLQVLFLSDGSTDRTVEILRSHAAPTMTVVELPVRRGKAAALNAGLDRARHEIVIFSDAGIELEPDALHWLVRQFRDPQVGCVSGEDRIAESGGEAWYGRYELFLRRLESKVRSIVGASGSFYAQRRALCEPFVEGMSPDFLSVLRTIEKGFRAVSEPAAVGTMTSLKDPKREFERKVRTLIRGMTTLFAHARMLNPMQHGIFAFELWSHKIMKWLVPIFLLAIFLFNLTLLGQPLYVGIFVGQIVFYGLAWFAFLGIRPIDRSVPGRFALYFTTVNAAVLAAWFQYGRGVRQELWIPSRR
jgi:cellulose synthase/poly-beta-1,6-N-acetylglucosamine synthase-like glycosyltransferase